MYSDGQDSNLCTLYAARPTRPATCVRGTPCHLFHTPLGDASLRIPTACHAFGNATAGQASSQAKAALPKRRSGEGEPTPNRIQPIDTQRTTLQLPRPLARQGAHATGY